MSVDLVELEARTRRLLASDRVTASTRAALVRRLGHPAAKAGALTSQQLETLAAAAARLLPLGELQARLELACRLDVELTQGRGDGWRYADTPTDAAALPAGLAALDAASPSGRFCETAPERQDELLERARTGELGEGAARWFEETLAALARLAYAHPLLQVSIGYDGMADAHGFQDLDAPAR